MGHRTFSDDFKDAIVRKILNRGDQTITEVCRQEGVVLSCAIAWMEKYANVTGMTKSRSSAQWTAEEKLKVLIQGNGLSGEELGVFLRKEGNQVLNPVLLKA